MEKWFLVKLTALLCGAAMMHSTMTRSLGLSLVCITSNSSNDTGNTNGNGSSCSATRYNWDMTIRGYIISVHDFGELALLPLSGLLISMFDPALILLLASGSAILANVLFPVATLYLDFVGAMLARFLLGVSHAFTAPSVDAAVSKWTPSTSRTTIYSFITCGSQMAVIVGNPLIALLCGACLFGGWPAIFYLVSIASVCWLGAFAIFYRRHLMPVGRQHDLELDSGQQRLEWSYICQSLFYELICRPAFWALLPCSASATVTVRLFTFYIPSFYRDVLKLPLMENAIYLSFSFAMLVIGKIFFSYLADLIVRHHLLTRNTSSKAFNCVSFLGSGTCILIAGIAISLPAQATIAVLTCGLILFSASTPGYLTSLVSMNRKWTGIISAVCAFTAMLTGIALPYFIAATVIHNTADEWARVFCYIAACDAVTAVFYAFFGYVESAESSKEEVPQG